MDSQDTLGIRPFDGKGGLGHRKLWFIRLTRIVQSTVSHRFGMNGDPPPNIPFPRGEAQDEGSPETVGIFLCTNLIEVDYLSF